jgi:hypothetical protein
MENLLRRSQIHRIGQHKLLSRYFIALVMIASSGCESTQIFAEPDRPPPPQDETLLSVGVCADDEDCPQWTCVTSICKEGQCIPERQSSPSLNVQAVLSEESYLSLSLRDDQLIAVIGEPDTDLAGAHSLGVGSGLRRWTLEDGQWNESGDWSPSLVRITIRPPLIVGADPEESREPLTLRGVTLTEGGLWLHAGEALRDVWYGSWNQSTSQGTYHRLAAPLQAIIQDEEEAWASIFDKGLERLDLSPPMMSDDDMDEVVSFEANARFNTPGRALSAQAGRSFVVVADGYAGLSLFNKRGDTGLSSDNPARRLITPPQELSTEGRVVYIDLFEDRVMSAELGVGVGFSRITPEGGLKREFTVSLGGEVRWVSWVDAYTAIVWVEGRGVVALDLLSAEEAPSILAEVRLKEIANDEISAVIWSADQDRFALLNSNGTLFQGALNCATP